MAKLIIRWQSTPIFQVNRQQIRQHLESILRCLKTVDRVEIEIAIVTDKKIKELKQRFLEVNEPTDVLSFPYDGEILGLTGSIVISVETARKQAAVSGIELGDEIKTLAGHGLLHLLGYTHR